MKKYILEVNERQLNDIAIALEIIARVQIGQLDTIQDLFMIEDYDRMEVHNKLDEAKQLIFPDLSANEYYGIHSEKAKKSKSQELFDMYKQMRHELSKDLSDWNIHKQPHDCLTEEGKIKIRQE